MKVLGIETSCDETGVALYDTTQGLLSQALYSQVALHARYGGVVPELASRDHIRRMLPLLTEVLSAAHCQKSAIDAIAYTAGPGLLGALMVGAAFAKSLAFALNIPALPVHHMEGHLVAALLSDNPPAYPFVALLVSGGHTQLFSVKAFGQYECLGESLDDAVGEAFDKTAKLLGLPYPGGPALSALARHGRQGIFHLPRPMLGKPGLMFSFSGLKTAVLQAWQSSDQNEQTKADLALAFEEAVVDTLIHKCMRAMRSTRFKHLVVAGGVSANQPLRERLTQCATTQRWRVHYPPLPLCTDNGVMIAYAGALHLQHTRPATPTPLNIHVQPRWPLGDLGDYSIIEGNASP